MDEIGNILQRNKIGEIVIKGETVIKKYANNETANLSSFFDSWFKTGDLGFIDKDGYIKITGRIKEIINKGGEKISPKEIDDVLQEIDVIEQVVCFPFKSKKYGEEIGCAIVLKETRTISEKELIEYASKNLAKFKIPDKFIFCNEIPKGPTGKLQRIGLSKTLGLDNEQL
jgi:acyl-CoA synthetase (AMP-forming)/AMP-acid ligase II